MQVYPDVTEVTEKSFSFLNSLFVPSDTFAVEWIV